MKYLRISNKGELDIRLIALMGGTTKADNPNKIGQFGTGLKYAISFFIRNNVKFRLFVGLKEVIFTSKAEKIAGADFKEIYCNGKSMNITTHYGYQWKAWEALREIFCNATDEGGELKQLVDSNSKLTGKTGETVFYIGLSPQIKEVLDKWDSYFFKDKPLFEDATVAIYKNPGDTLKLYKSGVLIQDSTYYKSLFIYDLKQANLNELRQYQGFLSSDIAKSLLASNKAVIDLLIAGIKNESKKDALECKLDWSYVSFNPAHVKSIFNGRLYLHPQSSDGGEKSVKVNETLFDLLTKAGVLTERIKQTTGSWYGGGGLGHRQYEKISYKEVLNPALQKRIQAIAVKYGSAMKYSIAVPKQGEFDFVVNKDQVIFSTSLETLSDADLQATVLISILHSQESNIYKAFKRLIKYATANRNFRKMLFGRNISDKIKPTYQPPVISKEKNTQPDYDELPF